MKKVNKHIGFLVALLLVSSVCLSQRICDNTRERVQLSDGTAVVLYKERGSDTYYYVPTALQLSKRAGKREYSFQEYKNEGSSHPDGAIFHCLVTWGLTKSQVKELQQYVKNKYGGTAILAGAKVLQPNSQDIHFSDTSIGRILKYSLKSKGTLPTIASSKMALSFHIKKKDVIVVRDALRSPSKFKNTTLTFTYKFTSYTCNSGYNPAMDNVIKVTGNLKKWF